MARGFLGLAKRAAAASLLALLVQFAFETRAQEATGDTDEDVISEGFSGSLGPIQVTRVRFPREMAGALGPGGGWLPVVVEMETRSPTPISVEIVGTVLSANDERVLFTTRRSVELAGGARRRVWLYLFAESKTEYQVAQVDVRAGAETRPVLHGETIVLASQNTPPVRTLVGGENPRDIWIASGGRPGQATRRGVHFFCAEAELPDSSLGYRSFDLVILRGIDASRLSPAQSRAIREHVALGGHVVFGFDRERPTNDWIGEVGRELFRGAVRSDVRIEPGLVPRSVWMEVRGDVAARMDRAWLQAAQDNPGSSWLHGPAGIFFPAGTQLVHADPFVETDRLIRTLVSLPTEPEPNPSRPLVPKAVEGGQIIYGEAPFGRGRVGALTIDERTVPASDSRATLMSTSLWAYVVGIDTPTRPSYERRAASPMPVEALFPKGERDVGFSFIVAFVVSYVIIVGPLLYLFLRRLGKLHAILWIEPLIIVLALAAVLGYTYFSKGLLTRVRSVTVLQQYGSSPIAMREGFLEIFSGGDESFGIEASGVELVDPIWAHEAEVAKVAIVPTVSAEGRPALAIDRLALDRWQTGYARWIAAEDLAGGVKVETLEARADGVRRFRVTNGTPWRIRQGAIRNGLVPTLFGAIEPGGAIELESASAASSAANVDSEVDPVEEAEARRKELVDTLIRWCERSDSLSGRVGSLRESGPVLLWAELDRDSEDFTIDRPATFAERLDLLVVREGFDRVTARAKEATRARR